MLFYKIEAEITNITEDEIKETQKDYDYKKLLQTKLTLFHETNEKECLLFISSMHNRELIMGAAIYDVEYFEKRLPEFLSVAGIEYRDVKMEEITLSGTKALMELSSNNGFIKGCRDMFERLDMESFSNGGGNLKYKEALLPAKPSKKALLQKAERLLCQGGLSPELDRIYQPVKHLVPGHPVHYIIQSDNDDVAKEVAEILLSALYANHRIKNRRYVTVNLKGIKRLVGNLFGGNSVEEYDDLYKSCEGGAVMVNLMTALPEDTDLISTETEKVEVTCKTALQYRNKTLTVFHLPRAAERIKTVMREHLDSMTLIELAEDAVSHEEAKAYLKQSAREHGVKIDKMLCKDIRDKIKTYSISELNVSFRHWYDNQLKNRCYVQYAEFESAGRMSAKKKKPKGGASVELDKMIGLAEAKSVIYQAVDYFKAQKLFSDRGISGGRPSMHMVFSGSPGTAKTTAARLFAQIMKDNGLLSVGSLVEVGRADLVGKYVGWTAQIVKSKFKEAKGSVLFIDEAYSLVEERGGLYGDEAINTIVQEMENMREDVVVIFAGYTDKMEEFLQRNPGLRSRIAFHVPFSDYSSGELWQILELMAKKQRLSLDVTTENKLLPIFAEASREPDFGNGRFVRNLLEKARMKQAGRILKMDVDNVSNEDVSHLTAEDFEAPTLKRAEIRKIGFGA